MNEFKYGDLIIPTKGNTMIRRFQGMHPCIRDTIIFEIVFTTLEFGNGWRNGCVGDFRLATEEEIARAVADRLDERAYSYRVERVFQAAAEAGSPLDHGALKPVRRR